MKIKSYKVPVTLKRDPQTGRVSMEIFDQNKEAAGEPVDLGEGTNDIVGLSKKLADENEKQKTLIQATLFASENEKETHVIFKYLVE